MKVYEQTRDFPREEIYGLTSQLRRAALSVPTNISEGMTRQTTRDKAHFLVQSEASLAETGYLIDVAGRLGYLKHEGLSVLTALHEETAKILHGLLRKLRQPLQELKA